MKENKKQAQKKNYFKGKNDLLVCKKLAKAFKLKLSDEDACYFADITPWELSRYEVENSQLKEKKALLRERYAVVEKESSSWVSRLKTGDKRIKAYEEDEYSLESLSQRYMKKLEDFGSEKTEADERTTISQLEELESKAINAMSLDTKELMLKAIPFGSGHREFALEMTKDLERDFEVKTATEKSLVQMAVLAFINYLHVNYEVQQFSYFDDYKYDQRKLSGYLMAVSKEKNNAFRQYTSTIQVLKSLKSTPINFKISTQSVNIGQQQQINNTESHET